MARLKGSKNRLPTKADLQKMIDDLNEQIVQLQNEIKSPDGETMKELCEEVKQLQEEKVILKKSLVDEQDLKKLAQDKINEWARERSQTTDQIRGLKSELKLAEEVLDRQDNRIESLQKRVQFFAFSTLAFAIISTTIWFLG